MRVQTVFSPGGQARWLLIDDQGRDIAAVHSYLKYLDNIGRSEYTLRSYCYHLKLFFEWLATQGLEYDGICSAAGKGVLRILAEFMAWLRLPYAANPKIRYLADPLSASEARRKELTVGFIMSAIISFYDYLARDGEMPALDIYTRKRRNRHFRSFLGETVSRRMSVRQNVITRTIHARDEAFEFITRSEYDRLRANCRCARDELIVFLMFEGGLRLGEVLGLQWTDLLLCDNCVCVVPRENLTNRVHVKNRAEGRIEVPPEFGVLYHRYLEELTKQYGGAVRQDYVFVNLAHSRPNRPLSERATQKMLERLGKRTGIPADPENRHLLHAHMFRHGHCSELIMAGLGLAFVQERMRHRSINTTMHYVHMTDEFKSAKLAEFWKNREGDDSCER